MPSTTVTVRLEQDEKDLIADYAKTFGTSVSELMRQGALEHIEDELDIEAYKRAKAEFEADPTTYSSDEVMKMFGLA